MTRRAAEQLVALYPPQWRARYGNEFIEVLVEQPLSLRLLVDVAAGALDARIQRTPAEAPAGGRMTRSLMKRCAHGGPQLGMADAWRSAAAMIGASLTFASLYILAKLQLGDSELVDALGIMAYPAALLVTMPFSYMKDASAAAKVIVVGGSLVILAGCSYLATLI